VVDAITDGLAAVEPVAAEEGLGGVGEGLAGAVLQPDTAIATRAKPAIAKRGLTKVAFLYLGIAAFL